MLALILIGASGPIGEFHGATGDAIDLLPSLKDYLIGLGIGTPGIVLFSLLIPIAQMNGGGSVVRVATLAGLGSDAVLDVAAGTLGWGMLGMGLATSIASWVQLIILTVYVARPKSTVRFRLRGAAW